MKKKRHDIAKDLGVAPVDSSKWSKESLGIPVPPPAYYRDEEYRCWHCRKPAIFTARDQKYAYEVKQRYFWQRRRLCGECWSRANQIKARLEEYENDWSKSKQKLLMDREALANWLKLLVELEGYTPYRQKKKKKNMLKKLLEKNA
ncbi:MAG: zinc-ribbon domain containing protein [Candidatus Thiodiazotropha taylori]|nr:zinc-ribbon domain containing protein [Candidatus Thiodiazotropha endolucinida]MCW4230806.1 zinc-ribbon domain containing protein [Candidatus Thiodiazotropha taylori]